MTEAQGRHQLKIVVAIDLSFADNEAHTPLSQDTTYLQMHQDLARRYIQLYEAKIVQDFEPFAVAEFGSVLLAFDSIDQIRTVLFELEQKSQIRPQVRLIRPRFSCHLGEIPTGQPILESSVVRRANAMIELAQSGEIVVSRTVYDMLPKQQADFAEKTAPSLVCRLPQILKTARCQKTPLSWVLQSYRQNHQLKKAYPLLK